MAIVVWLVLLEGLYLRALRVLRGRGVAVPRWQIVAWHAAMALWIVGLLSPIDGARRRRARLPHGPAPADRRPGGAADARRAAQPDAGVLPPPPRARAAGAHAAGCASGFRFLRRPLVALPVYVLVLYGWHFSIFFEAAVRHPLVHALQHSSFIAIGVLVWWSVLEPKRRRLRGRAVEDRPHPLRALPRHVPGDVLRADPPADLHRRLRQRGARAGPQPDRRPAAGGRDDGRRSTSC